MGRVCLVSSTNSMVLFTYFGLCTVLYSRRQFRVKVVQYMHCKIVHAKKIINDKIKSPTHFIDPVFLCLWFACANKNHERKISFIFSFIHSSRQSVKRWLQCACRNETNEIMSPPLQIRTCLVTLFTYISYSEKIIYNFCGRPDICWLMTCQSSEINVLLLRINDKKLSFFHTNGKSESVANNRF